MWDSTQWHLFNNKKLGWHLDGGRFRIRAATSMKSSVFCVRCSSLLRLVGSGTELAGKRASRSAWQPGCSFIITRCYSCGGAATRGRGCTRPQQHNTLLIPRSLPFYKKCTPKVSGSGWAGWLLACILCKYLYASIVSSTKSTPLFFTMMNSEGAASAGIFSLALTNAKSFFSQWNREIVSPAGFLVSREIMCFAA